VSVRTDLVVTLRGLAAARGHTAIVILTLALGMGASSAVFAVVHAVLLRPLPFTDPDRLVVLGEFSPASETRLVSPVTFDEWKTRHQTFEGIAAFRYWETVNLEDGRSEPEPITLATATANFFEVLKIAPAVGRTYRDEQSRQGGSEAVISHELWRRRYGSDPGVLGRVIRIRGTPTTIVGVMPALPVSLAIGWGDVWTCLYRYDIAQQRATKYRSRYLTVVGRLPPDVSMVQAQARLSALQRQLWREPTSVAEGFDVTMQPLGDVLTGAVRLPLLVIAGAVGVLLLVACANVATLMLVRVSMRRREMAMRFALGARPADVARLLAIEAAVVALAASVGGGTMAWAALRTFSHFAPSIPRLSDARLGPETMGFTFGLALVAALLCAVVPLLESGRKNLSRVLSESGRSGTPGRRAQRLRHTLVALQIGLACLLLIAGALLLRSFVNVLRVNPGFDAARAVYLDLYLPNSRYPDEASYTRFYRDLVRRLESHPKVESAGSLLYFPFKPKLWPVPIEAEGLPVREGEEPIVYYNQIGGAYFRAMGIPLEHGRLPDEREIWERTDRRVVVVNRALARQLFGAGDPIGRRVRSGRNAPWSEIIGVVGDVRQQQLDRPASPEFYTTFQQMPMPFQSIVVRGRVDHALSIDDVRRVVQELDAGLALANLMPLSDWVTSHTRERQFALAILSSFAVLALTIGTVGVYGAMSYTVGQRTREIGVRLALGATPARARLAVVADGVRVVAIGALAGTGAALLATPLIARLLFDVAPFDVMTFLGVPTLIVGVGAIACWLPASTAVRGAIINSLRAE
jgi:predicted permease